MFGFGKKEKTLVKKSDADFWVSKYQLTYFDFSQQSDIAIALQTVPELNAIINYIAKSFSTGIWKHGELQNSWLLDLLQVPHPFYSENELKQLISHELIAYGVCHLYANSASVVSKTKTISVLPTHLTDVITDKKNADVLELDSKSNNFISYYKINWADGVKKIEPDKVITISLSNIININNNKIQYESPLTPLSNVLKTSTAIYETMYELNFNRGAVGIISNDNQDASGTIPLDENEVAELQKQFRKYGTLKNKWHLMFSDTKLSFQAISSPLKDMMLPEQLKQVKQTIADVLGFDTILLNNQDGNKYANYNEARKSFFSELIIPLAETVSNSLTDYFLFARKNEKLTLDYSHLDIFAKDKKAQAEAINLQATYVINLNQSVVNNYLTTENAINLLIQNGYSEDEAKKLIQ